MTNTARYCPACGSSLESRRIEGRNRQFCPSCERPIYRNPKPCAGILVIDDKSVLLVKRTEPPDEGSWSVPAGYLEHDEPPIQAAVRELHEETGLQVDPEALFLHDAAFVRHPDGSHVFVLVHVTEREATQGAVEAGGDAGDAKFWKLGKLDDSEERLETGYWPLVESAIGRISG